MLRKLINSADATISITNAVKKHWIYEKTENAFQYFNAVKSISSLKNIYEHKEKYFLFCSTALEDYKGANWAMEAFCKSGLFNNTKIIKKAREFAIQNFTEEKYGKKIEIVYKTVRDNGTKEL